ncbi:ATP synthase F0 subunit B [Nocardiopsis dassonvillei]|uniref:ATP synthase F0 subunit B n=1 Tax=Nocardiopsis dassonvillei TaxID=2014 RepID=UPI00157D6D6B|nr:ATP synthase F0 subunit B [Nocardiopsis dassonvillei]
MLPGGGLQQDRFPTVRKGGYDKAHVDDYFVRTDNQVKSLRERLQRLDDELEQYKRDLAIAREKAQVKPEHEQISERMAEILRIAEEEAQERRSKVESEVKEAEKKAQDEIAKYRKDAEEHAERILSSARSEAHSMVDSAKKESDQLREQAKQEGERRLNEAEARAKKIHDTADRRLATLTATHAEALRRLKDMHSTLADLVAAEDKAGALESGLSRDEVAAAPAPAKPAPATPGDKDEATTKLPPLQQQPDEATVRIRPVAKPEQTGQDQAGNSSPKDQAQSAPRPPQGARFTGPAPEGDQKPQPGPQQGQVGPQQPQSGPQQGQKGQEQGGDPGITGIYRHPESGHNQPPKGEDGVRVIRKP